jgi:hypothetical protein
MEPIHRYLIYSPVTMQAAAADEQLEEAEALAEAARIAEEECPGAEAARLAEAAEEAMEMALEAVLAAEDEKGGRGASFGSENGDEEDEDDGEEEGEEEEEWNEEEEEEDGDKACDLDASEVSEDSEEETLVFGAQAALTARRPPASSSAPSVRPAPSRAVTSVAELVETPPPVSFSRIDTSLPAAAIAKEFPLFRDAIPLDVELCSGQMLYLPAGWFHEVTSRGVPGKPLHMAFNYWFHPPTALQPGSSTRPYTSMFWPREWAARSEATPMGVPVAAAYPAERLLLRARDAGAGPAPKRARWAGLAAVDRNAGGPARVGRVSSGEGLTATQRLQLRLEKAAALRRKARTSRAHK